MFVASRSKNNLYTFSSLEVKHPLLYGWLRRTVYLSDNALTAMLLQGVPYYWAHFVFVIFSGSRAHTEELFIAIG